MRRLLPLCLLLAACGGTIPGGEDDGLDEAALAARFDVHRLLEDGDILGEDLDAAQVQRLLDGYGSYLASYRDPAFPGQSAASIIVDEGRAAGVSPLYLLARIQIESSLVQSRSSRNLAQATGCGCPDGGTCSQSYRGFGKQVRCAAQKIAGYFRDLDTRGYTIADWRVGVAKRTLDPCTVTPQNRATAALYTYTPWVGANGRQCGRAGVGGSSAVARVHALYKANPAVAGAAPEPTCSSATVGRRVEAGTCVQARSDRRYYQCGADGGWDAAPDAAAAGEGPSGPCTALFAL
jgi:hypothetical protein